MGTSGRLGTPSSPDHRHHCVLHQPPWPVACEQRRRRWREADGAKHSDCNSHADPEDMQILTGDFNADAHSATLKELSEHMDHDYVGTSFGGVDNFQSNCASSAEATNLGNGGSDHDALSIVFTPGSN